MGDEGLTDTFDWYW